MPSAEEMEALSSGLSHQKDRECQQCHIPCRWKAEIANQNLTNGLFGNITIDPDARYSDIC